MKNLIYQSPSIEVVEIFTEGIIAASPTMGSEDVMGGGPLF